MGEENQNNQTLSTTRTMNFCCNKNENVEPAIHGGVDNGMVLIEHRSSAIEQVPVEQLRVQVPDISDPVPHALLLSPQLHCHFLAQGEPSFHLFGFLMCIAATAARALKSVLQGILLSSEAEKLNSMNLLMYMGPVAVAILLPAALLMEEDVVAITIDFGADILLAFQKQLLGNAKVAVAVVVSILILRNPVSVTGMLSYSLTVTGVILYSEAEKRGR